MNSASASSNTRIFHGATWIAATLLIAAGPMLGLVMSAHANWMHAFLAATIVSILSAAASMTLIAFGLRDSRLLPTAAMGATLIRATFSLGGGVVAILLLGVDAPPTLLMILGYYLAVLVAECAILFRAFQPLKEL